MVMLLTGVTFFRGTSDQRIGSVKHVRKTEWKARKDPHKLARVTRRHEEKVAYKRRKDLDAEELDSIEEYENVRE